MTSIAALTPTRSLLLGSTSVLRVSKRTKAARREAAAAATAAAASRKAAAAAAAASETKSSSTPSASTTSIPTIDKMVEPIIPNDEARQMKRAAEPTSDDGSRRMKRAAAHNKEVELALLAQDQDSASSSSSSSSTLLDSVAPIPSERTNTPKYLNDPELGSQKHVKVWETVPLRFPPRDRYPPLAPDIASDDLRLCAIALGVASLGARPTWRQGSPAEALAAVNQGLDSMVRKGDAVHKPPSDEAEQDKNTRDEALKIIDADGYWSSASVHTRYGDESPDWMFEDSKRLEWLGDAVVGLVARHTIMTRYPDLSVAGATQAWGHIVSNDTFGHLWDIAGLEAVRLKVGERITSEAVLQEKRRLIDAVVHGHVDRMEHEDEVADRKMGWDDGRKTRLEDTLDERALRKHPAMQAEALNAKFNPVLRHIGDGKMSHASKADHFEAFVGAMLLTRGFDATSAYLSPLLLPWVERISLSPGFHDRYRTPAAMIRAKQAQRAQAKALAERAAKSGLLTKVLRRVFGPMLRWIFPEVSTIVQKGRPKR